MGTIVRTNLVFFFCRMKLSSRTVKISVIAAMYTIIIATASVILLYSRLMRSEGSLHSLQTIKSCKCKSLFTIGGCSMSEVTNLRPNDSAWHKALNQLQALRSGELNASYTDRLSVFSRYLDQEFILENFHPSDDLERNKGHIKNTYGQLPFVSCTEVWFTNNEKEKCFRNYKLKNKVPLNVVFFGDSRTRFLMRYFLKLSEDSLLVSKENRQKMRYFYENKIDFDYTITFNLLNTTLKWVAYLDEDDDAITLLNSWCDSSLAASPKISKPDLLVVSSGSWHSTHKGAIDGIEYFFIGMKNISSCLKLSSHDIPVIWMSQPPMKALHDSTIHPNPPLDITNNLASHIFSGSNVWFWDTIFVLALKENALCKSFTDAGLYDSMPEHWKCLDQHHSGKWVYTRAANMLFNLLCGKRLWEHHNHCCQHDSINKVEKIAREKLIKGPI